MQRLPTEVFHLIFENLNFNHLLVCRSVCVEWRFAVQGYLFRIRTLAICRKVDLPSTGLHFLTNAPINVSMAAHVRNLNFLKVEMYRAILSRLHCLYVDFSYKGFHNFYLYINECRELEQLEIDHFGNNVLDVNLPSLRVMGVRDYVMPGKSYQLILNTPNLFAFRCSGEFQTIFFSYPEKITHLYLYRRFNRLPGIFMNLRYLYMILAQSPTYYSSGFYLDVPFSIPAKFKHLEEFHFTNMKSNYLTTLFRQIAQEASKMRLFSDGFSIKSIEDYEKHAKSWESFAYYYNTPPKQHLEHVFSNHAELASSVPWVQEVNFGSMLQLVVDISSNFFSKFLNIKKVNITETVYRIDQLVYFLSNCRVLNELYISNSMLPQTFFEYLPTYCPFLTALDIVEPYPIESLRFIRKFEYLQQMRIDQEASVNVVLRTLRKETIKCFEFRFRNEKFTVRKKSDKDTNYYEERTLNYNLYSDNFQVHSPTNNAKFDTLDELLRFLRIVMITA